MGIGVRPDHIGDLNMVAADLLSHVGEDAEAGDYLEFFSAADSDIDSIKLNSTSKARIV